MRYACVCCLALLLYSSTAYCAQNSDPKELPANKGSLVGDNSYDNPALGLSLSLPGQWQFFDRTSYSTPEQKQREKEMLEKARANCQGALCGPVEIDVALQSPLGVPPKYSIYLSAHKLAGEYQDRDRYPLRKFAETMSLGSLGTKWVPDGELTSIKLGGRSAYRLLVHNSHVTTAKGFLYVAESNGQVFMLLGVAMSEPFPLQSALEGLRFTDVPLLLTRPEADSQNGRTSSGEELKTTNSEAKSESTNTPGNPPSSKPSCFYSPSPRVTKEAIEAKFEGTVRVEATIMPDGRMTNIIIVNPPGIGLDESIVETLKTWKCTPATHNGKVVPAKVPIELYFRLGPKPNS